MMETDVFGVQRRGFELAETMLTGDFFHFLLGLKKITRGGII